MAKKEKVLEEIEKMIELHYILTDDNVDLTLETSKLSETLKHLKQRKNKLQKVVDAYKVDEEKNILVNKYLEVRFLYGYYELQYTFEELNLPKLQIQIVNELLFNITIFNNNIIKGKEANLSVINGLAADINVLFTMLDDKTVTILKNAIAFGDLALNDYITALPKLIEFMKEEKIIDIFKSLKLNKIRIRSIQDIVFDADVFDNIIKYVNMSEENMRKHNGVLNTDTHNWPS